MTAEPTEEGHEGPTPNGGVRSVAYFRDEHGDPCPKDRAAGMEIVEYDDKDEPIFRTYMQARGKGDVPI